jgi:hypothetical protein
MKEKVLCIIGAVVVLLGIASGVIFGSDEPQRVFLGGPNGVHFEGKLGIEVDQSTLQVRLVPLAQQKGVDVVIQGDVNFAGTAYHSGNRLTSEDGKLVHQSWYQIARNDIRYWAYRAKKKLKGKD